MAENTPDIERLGEVFATLGSSARLELISLLARPRRLQEIQLQARRSRAGENPDRLVSRQAVAMHVAKLKSVGMVVERVTPDGRSGFVTDATTLDSLIDQLREVRRRLHGAPVSST